MLSRIHPQGSCNFIPTVILHNPKSTLHVIHWSKAGWYLVQACPSFCPWYLPPCPCPFWRPWPSCTRQHGFTHRDMSEPVVSARHQTTKQRGYRKKTPQNTTWDARRAERLVLSCMSQPVAFSSSIAAREPANLRSRKRGKEPAATELRG